MKYIVVGFFKEDEGPDTETCPEVIDTDSKEEAVRIWGRRLTMGGDVKKYDYIDVSIHPSEWEHPLSLLADEDEWIKWYHEVGADEANRLITAACRRHMTRYGTRSILEVEERMSNLTARLGEFSA